MNNYVTYVLELEDDCWYIGVTSNYNKRFIQHVKGVASSWTRLHKPIRVFKVYKGFHEKKVTLAWMKIFGADKVRGHGFSLKVLQQSGISRNLKRMIQHARIPHKLCDELGVPHLKYKRIPWEVEYGITLPF